jgi:hypothetical protein
VICGQPLLATELPAVCHFSSIRNASRTAKLLFSCIFATQSGQKAAAAPAVAAAKMQTVAAGAKTAPEMQMLGLSFAAAAAAAASRHATGKMLLYLSQVTAAVLRCYMHTLLRS